MAHVTIDVIGDYALTHDSYDNLAHGSRELIAGVALVIAVILAARGLRGCCDIAQINRSRLIRVAFGARETVGYLLAAVAACCVLVPAMELVDGSLDGAAVRQLGDAFGGSLLLGLITTAVCATLMALIVFAVARWLLAHRDTIAAIIETLLRWNGDAVRRFTCDLERYRLTFRCRAPHALRFSKRGPPVTLFV
jgi:hypothetical protein